MSEVLHLSRRNLLTLLAKLDARKAGEMTACTVIKNRSLVNCKYDQTMDSIAVIAVEDEDFYRALNRPAGEMHPREEANLPKPSTGIV